MCADVCRAGASVLVQGKLAAVAKKLSVVISSVELLAGPQTEEDTTKVSDSEQQQQSTAAERSGPVNVGEEVEISLLDHAFMIP
jgi:hypothetical protein